MRRRPFAILCCAWATVCLLDAQLPPGRLSTRANRDEKETAQAGGKGFGTYWKLQDIRCENSGEAIVGIRTRTGTVLDHVQVRCAPVQCNGANCTWSNAYWGASAGGTGGYERSPMICRNDQAVSGFRATERRGFFGNFVRDISIQCAHIAGPSRGLQHNTFPIQEPTSYLHPEGNLNENAGALVGPFLCPNFSATAVSTATGKFKNEMFGPETLVVQALSLYCGWPGTESKERCPANMLYLGPNSSGNPICLPCISPSTSTNSITGSTDRRLAGVPKSQFNCHHYTLTYLNNVAGRIIRQPKINGTAGGSMETYGSFECLRDSDLAAAGFVKVMNGTIDPAYLKPGDVITVSVPNLDPNRVFCQYSHSGVVIQVDPTNPQSTFIRQKPNPEDCIIDYSWLNFDGLYVKGERAFAWRRVQAAR